LNRHLKIVITTTLTKNILFSFCPNCGTVCRTNQKQWYGRNRTNRTGCYGSVFIYPTVTSARSCNKVGHLFWFTILAQHETNDFILYIHSVHKHRGNSFQRQNYKMKLKQRSLNWINSMQVKKILFTNVFFSWSLSFLNM
jgi:hypothetical protein